MNRKKVLLTGGSGLFGANALLLGHPELDLIGLYNHHPVDLPGVKWQRGDLTDSQALRQVLDAVQPDAIIHAAAITNIDYCEDHREEAVRINVEVPRVLAEYCNENGVRYLHFSTDAFFEGEGKLFTEEDDPTPVNFYGETKLHAEQAIRKVDPKSLILRTTFWGWNAQDKLSLGEWILSSLAQKKPTPLFGDVLFTPIYAKVLAQTVLDLVAMPEVTGILHLGGSDVLSKLDFGTRLCHAFELDPSLIRPTPVQQGGLRARRSHAMALSTAKMQRLFPERNFSVNSAIRQFRDDLSNGWVRKLKGESWKFWS